MMRIDAHVHMGSFEENQTDFLKRLDSAEVDRANVFSVSPQDGLGNNWKKRLDGVLKLSKGTDRITPFFWIDPTDNDAIEQCDVAAETGIAGFKCICSHFYPGDEKAMEVFRHIADLRKPLMFHSGILWDGVNASGKFNRPCNFEELFSLKGLKFSLAHIGWPWTDECIAVYGKLSNYRKSHPDAPEMFVDLTPGTPVTYREQALIHLFCNGFDIENNVFMGTDSVVSAYNDEGSARRIFGMDEEIFRKLRFTAEQRQKILSDNFNRFLG